MNAQKIPVLTIGQALDKAISRIFDCSGRSRRSEYWWVQLIMFLSGLVLTPLAYLFLSILAIPLTIRRLHDTGRSGW